MVIYDYYSMLDKTRKTLLREKIMKEAQFSYATFFYKMRNKSFKPCETKVIGEIIEEFENARKN